jgi:CheY-like chemotaxis protein
MRKPPGTETGSATQVEILLVSTNEADHASLDNILREPGADAETNSGWIVYRVGSVAAALETIGNKGVAIVISECDSFPDQWRTVLESISVLPDPPLLIVASRLADDHLWAEALNLGAWDVLPKPFQKQEVIRVLASAWRHWQYRRDLPKGRNTA